MTAMLMCNAVTAADLSQASVSPFAAALDTQECPELGQMLPAPLVLLVPGQATSGFGW